jgi:prepilin-type N-terminal cleavage/methylation domain-containing protein
VKGEQGFSLVELLLALAIGCGLSGVILQALVAEVRVDCCLRLVLLSLRGLLSRLLLALAVRLLLILDIT